MSAQQIVGSLIVRLHGDGTDFSRMLDYAVNHTRRAMSDIQVAGAGLTNALTAPIVAMGDRSVRAFSGFNQALTQSAAIMNLAGDQLQRMEQRALSLAMTTPHSAAELAGAFYQLASSGLNAEQAIAALPTVARFATAGMLTLERATEQTAQTQQALGMRVQDPIENLRQLTRVTDVLTRANNDVLGSVQDFSNALVNSAPSFRNMRVQLEEAMTLLMAYHAQGRRGFAAGTLATRFNQLLASSAREASEAHRRLGFDVFHTAETVAASLARGIPAAIGDMRRYADIAQNLETITRGMAPQQISQVLAELGFEARIQQAVTPILGMSEAMSGFRAQVDQAGGTTLIVFNKQMESFANQMTLVSNNVENAAIGVGSRLAPALLLLGAAAISVTAWFNTLPSSVKDVTVVTLGLVAAIGPLLLIIGFIGPAFVRGFAMAKVAVIATTIAIYTATAATLRFVVTAALFDLGRVFWIVRAAVIAVALGIRVATVAMIRFAVAAALNPITWIVVALAAFAALAVLVNTSSTSVRDFNREMERSATLAERLRGVETAARDRRQGAASGIADPTARRSAIQAEIAAEEQRIAGMRRNQASFERERARYQSPDTPDWQVQFGRGEWRVAVTNIAEYQARIDAATASVQRMRNQLNELAGNDAIDRGLVPLRESIQAINRALREQMHNHELNTHQAAIAAEARMGSSDIELRISRLLERQNRAMAMNREHRSPVATFTRDLAELQELLEHGLNPDAFARGMRAIEDTLIGTTRATRNPVEVARYEMAQLQAAMNTGHLGDSAFANGLRAIQDQLLSTIEDSRNLRQELGRIEGVSVGSAEALHRMSTYQDSLRESLRPSARSLVEENRRITVEGSPEQLRSLEVLREINRTLIEMSRRPVSPLPGSGLR